MTGIGMSVYSCCQCVKDRNFESNSQHAVSSYPIDGVVVSVSKIEISKAIHNLSQIWMS